MEGVHADLPQRWRSVQVRCASTRLPLWAILAALLSPTCGFVPDHPVEDGAHYFVMFPKPTANGVFFAMAVPLETVNKDVTVAFNFDASYSDPANATELSILESEFGWRRRATRAIHSLRDVSRGIVYDGFEKALGKMNMPERPCLLQAICEAAERPMGLDEHDLLGDIVHLVLTPSRSADPDVHDDFHRAERLGREGKNCAAEYSECGFSILGLISIS